MRDHDLTTGSIAGHFRTLAVPAALGMLFSTLYNVVDVYFAGQLSTDAQAGLAVGFQAFFVLMSVGFGLSAAMSALVGNAKGRKQGEAARQIAAQGMVFGLISTAVLMVLALIFGHHLIALVSEPGAYRDAANAYFRWLVFALPGFLFAYGGNGILQAHGDSVTQQRGMMVAFIANCGLNPMFMYGLPGIWGGLGLNGIALATIVSQTGVMLWVLWHVARLPVMAKLTRKDFVPNPSGLREILAQMLPTSTALMVMFISGFVVQFALKGFGSHALAAYGVALRIEQILLLPILGMTGALLPIAAQNFGAGAHDRVREAVQFCWKVGILMTIVAGPTLWLGGRLAMALFTDEPAVIEAGVSYLHVEGFLLPAYMFLFSINSLLQALKQPRWTLWISLYRQGFGIAFFIWILVGLMKMDVWGVWLGIAISVLSGLALALAIAVHVTRVKIGGLREKAQDR